MRASFIMRLVFMRIIFLTIVLGSVLFSQPGVFAQKSTEFFVISDQMAACGTNDERKCLQIKKPHENQWSIFAEQIENFNYREGYFYLVSVNKIHRKRAKTGESPYFYRLKRILTREKIPQNAPFDGTKWILDKIDGESIKTEQAFISFDTENERFGGKGGCNGMGGNLSVEGSKIKMSEIISTKMYCEGLSEIENRFIVRLEQTTRFLIKEKRLYLYRDGKLLLELAAA